MIITREQVLASFKWSEAKEIGTKRGPRMMRKAEVTDESNRFYNANRGACASMGVLKSEWPEGSGKWSFTWFEELSEEAKKAKMDSRAASRATNADVEIARPRGLDYLPFQKAGIAYMRGRRGILLADEMGLGKTIQVIGKINDDPTIVKVAVIMPASLTLNWIRELRKWLVRPATIGVVDGKCFPTTEIVVMSYDMAVKWKERLGNQHWDLLVLDEAHYVKNSDTLRAKAILGYKPKKDEPVELASAPIPARMRIFATGTPVCNKPRELWPLVSVLDPVTFNSWWKFHTKYCGMGKTEWGMSGDGTAGDLEGLQVVLRESIMVRRLKKEVLTELPPKMRSIIVTPKTAAVRHAEEKFKRDNGWDEESDEVVECEVAMEIAKAEDNPEAYAAAVAKLGRVRKVPFEELAAIEHLTAREKVPAAVEHIRSVLESTEKVIVWAHHHDVLDALHVALKEFGSLISDGRHSVIERQRNVDLFQNHDRHRVHVCGLTAMGVGHTMTEANVCVFVELDWVPGNVAQAEDRAHRIGQRNSVFVHQLVMEDSIDYRKAEVLVAKLKIIDRAVDKKSAKEMTIGGSTRRDVESIEAENARGEKLSPFSAGERDVSAPKSENERMAGRMTDEVLMEIQRCLQELAAMCDGAKKVDGNGFNKFDTSLGKSLAWSPRFTGKMGALGLRLITKYQRQLGVDRVAAIYGKLKN